MKRLAQSALGYQNGEQRVDVLPADTRARVVRQAKYRGSRIARPVVFAAGAGSCRRQQTLQRRTIFYAWWLIRASGTSPQAFRPIRPQTFCTPTAAVASPAGGWSGLPDPTCRRYQGLLERYAGCAETIGRDGHGHP